MRRIGISITFVLAAGIAAAGCGSGGESSSDATRQESTQNPTERQDAEFLSLINKNGVLSAQPDPDLVKLGRSVCDDVEFVRGFPEGVAGQLRSKDPSLDEEESWTVIQAAVKIYCPEAAKPGA
ncbi:DUF732 domain-containing protein [Streptomyces filamentosus]|uniref:DUF732 domain-containing protein n=1 Tax=Streptomyces filamentosus TaxID=67294 RepID=UPI00382409B8